MKRNLLIGRMSFALLAVLLLALVAYAESKPVAISPEAHRPRVPPQPPITGNPTVTPTSTATPTPTATPSARPTQQCQIYELRFEHVESPWRKSGRTFFNQTNAKDLACFTELYKSIEPSHDPEAQTTTWKGATRQLWSKLLAKVNSYPGADSDSVYQSNKKYIDCKGKWGSPRGDGHNAHFMIGGGQRAGNDGRKTPGCSTGSLFVNDKCEMQPISSIKESVGQCYMTLKAEVATPLSLVWSDVYKSEPSTIVDFKLNPYSSATRWMWRASESLPLLVHDPENTGSITSAKQLFGHWAFGGKEANPSPESGTPMLPWRDGYEALATLDKDLDGAVAGEELSTISLWFDANRDGISQPGEVKRAVSLGITKLYYQADTVRDGAQFATKGYERNVDGVSVQRSSIDWLEQDASLQSSIAVGGFAVDQQSAQQGESSESKSTSGEPHGPAGGEFARDLLGKWTWEIDGQQGTVGFLAFEPDEEGIVGVTLSSVGMQGVPEVNAQIIFSHFEAEASKTSSGLTEVSFVVEGASGAQLSNVATVSDDGTVMIGKTVVTDSENAQSGSYEYTWRAKKLS